MRSGFCSMESLGEHMAARATLLPYIGTLLLMEALNRLTAGCGRGCICTLQTCRHILGAGTLTDGRKRPPFCGVCRIRSSTEPSVVDVRNRLFIRLICRSINLCVRISVILCQTNLQTPFSVNELVDDIQYCMVAVSCSLAALLERPERRLLLQSFLSLPPPPDLPY